VAARGRARRARATRTMQFRSTSTRCSSTGRQPDARTTERNAERHEAMPLVGLPRLFPLFRCCLVATGPPNGFVGFLYFLYQGFLYHVSCVVVKVQPSRPCTVRAERSNALASKASSARAASDAAFFTQPNAGAKLGVAGRLAERTARSGGSALLPTIRGAHHESERCPSRGVGLRDADVGRGRLRGPGARPPARHRHRCE